MLGLVFGKGPSGKTLACTFVFLSSAACVCSAQLALLIPSVLRIALAAIEANLPAVSPWHARETIITSCCSSTLRAPAAVAKPRNPQAVL